MKTFIVFVAGIFSVALAVVVGNRLPVDAVTVIVGIVCGVLASIPTSLLIIAVTARRDGSVHAGRTPPQTYPPVVVVNGQPGSAPVGLSGTPQPMSWPGPAPSSPRKFHIIGQEPDVAEGQSYFR